MHILLTITLFKIDSNSLLFAPESFTLTNLLYKAVFHAKKSTLKTVTNAPRDSSTVSEYAL